MPCNKNNILTKTGEPRGYIDPAELRELWFNSGTICNLRCPSCFEKSSPESDRLEQLSFKEVKSLIDEALTMNVQSFSFTGGEPFVNKDFLSMLDYALDYKPCLVLTNGTEPLINNFVKLKEFITKPNKLTLRISIDYPDKKEHDNQRGEENFAKSCQSLKMLYDVGFDISVAGRCETRKNEYRTLFAKCAIPEDTPMVFFPELSETGTPPEITEKCMTTYKTAETRALFMCSYSKMVVKKEGKISVIPCTLVDDDDSYDLGTSLEEAMRKRIILKHPRCYTCFANGISCSRSASSV
jgi:sulfatase maturation enzyme AslB (radical SAM superfamily)